MKIQQIQFNVTTGKEYRANMAKYYNAKHELNDYICSAQRKISGLNDIIQTDLERIEKAENGETIIGDVEKIKADVVANYAKVKDEQEKLAKARAKANKACEKAIATVTDAMYEAAKEQDDDAFNKAFAAYLVANGFDTATPENVPVLHFGVKANGAKKACKTGMLNGFMSQKAWTTVFLNTLADTLYEQKVIEPYKYKFDPDAGKKSK